MIDRQKAVELMMQQAEVEAAAADEWATLGSASSIIKHVYGEKCFERAARILESMPDGVVQEWTNI